MGARQKTRRIAVVADDLTGATDTGVQFAKQGLRTLVWLGADPLPRVVEESVVVVETHSRAMPPEEAYRRAAGAAAWLSAGRFELFFKKIDSTLRGNIGREIDAVMDTCKLGLAIVAPAYPKNGRIVAGGYLFLHGVPLEATEIARDPTCPVAESHIPTLLASQTSRKVGHVGIKRLVAGAGGVLEAIGRGMDLGEEVIVCDAWQDEHLKMLADAALRLEKPVLWVGSAGLAEQLPSALGLQGLPALEAHAEERRGKGAPVLVMAGSVSRATRVQVAMLMKRPDLVHIETDPPALLRPDTATPEIRRCSLAACAAVRSGKDVVITSGLSEDLVAGTLKQAVSLELSSRCAAEEITSAMGRLCREIALNAKPGGLVLTGGDIARGSCSQLCAAGIALLEEIAPGIPLGLLKGGPCDGMGVVTKAGAFGAEDALCRAVDRLRQGGKESFES